MKAWRRIFPLLLIVLLLCAASYSQDKVYRVNRVVDGDTLLLTNGERVRLIGVDTPEVHESKKLYRDAQRTGREMRTIRTLGKKASAFTRSLVDKKEVRLEYDQANAHIGHRNKYGRILAYVYLTDGTFVNAEITRQGYGFAYTRFPFQHIDDFGNLRGRQGRIRKGCGGRITGANVRNTDALMGEKGSSVTDKSSDNAKTVNPRVAMIPALLVQVWQIIYAYLISVPRIESLIAVAMGLAWLILLPGLGPVTYLAICQAINVYLASLVAVSVPRGSPYLVIPLLSILFSIVSVILMIRGLRAIRKQKVR